MNMPPDKPSIEVYRDAVKRLTAEIKQFQDELWQERQRRTQEVGLVTTQLNEGISPELLVLRRELRSWRERALAAEGRLREIRKGRIPNAR
jgi:hypothetical protein